MKGRGYQMKILVAQTSSKEINRTIDLMKEKLERNYSTISIEVCDSTKRPVTCADIRKSEADLFINFNLIGFEQSTLTDGVAYNLLDCKQIHILLKKGLVEEKYLAKQLSISMFFYCIGMEYFRYLQERYPNLPYLKVMEGWKEEFGEERRKDSADYNAEILCSVVKEVAQLCQKDI